MPRWLRTIETTSPALTVALLFLLALVLTW